MTQLVFGSGVFGLGLTCRLSHVRITLWGQRAPNSLGTQTSVTVPNQTLQAVLGAMTAPYSASQIPLALGFEPFSIPPLSHRARHWFKLYQNPERLLGLPVCSSGSCPRVPGLGQPCATDTSVLSTQQLPPNFVTAAVSQDMATVPARKGTFYPAETGQQFKWGSVITHTSVWPSNGIGCLRGEHPPCLLEAVQTLEMKSHMSKDALTIPGRSS